MCGVAPGVRVDPPFASAACMVVLRQGEATAGNSEQERGGDAKITGRGDVSKRCARRTPHGTFLIPYAAPCDRRDGTAVCPRPRCVAMVTSRVRERGGSLGARIGAEILGSRLFGSSEALAAVLFPLKINALLIGGALNSGPSSGCGGGAELREPLSQ